MEYVFKIYVVKSLITYIEYIHVLHIHSQHCLKEIGYKSHFENEANRQQFCQSQLLYKDI